MELDALYKTYQPFLFSIEVYQLMSQFEKYMKTTEIDHKLIELMKIRASQINGCAFCLDMHTKDARANGETEQRIYCLSAWRETPFYQESERVALELTEAVTTISANGVPDDLYERVRLHLMKSNLSISSQSLTQSTVGTDWHFHPKSFLGLTSHN